MIEKDDVVDDDDEPILKIAVGSRRQSHENEILSYCCPPLPLHTVVVVVLPHAIHISVILHLPPSLLPIPSLQLVGICISILGKCMGREGHERGVKELELIP